MSGIRVSSQYELSLDANCHYDFPLYFDPNMYWDNYDISGGMKMFEPEFHIEKYVQNVSFFINPGANSEQASSVKGNNSTGGVTLSATTWPASTYLFGGLARYKYKYDYNGKNGLLNIVKKLSTTRKVNGTNYTLYQIESEGIGKLVHSYESVFDMQRQAGTYWGTGSSSYTTGSTAFIGIATQQYSTTGTGTNKRYVIQDPSSSFTRIQLTKSSCTGTGDSWSNQSSNAAWYSNGTTQTATQIGAKEFTTTSFDVSATEKKLWTSKPMAESSKYSKPNVRSFIFSRNQHMPANADLDYCITADMQKGNNTIWTVVGGANNTIDSVKAWSTSTRSAFAKVGIALYVLPPLKTYTWHSNTKYAPGTSDKFSYLPATIVTYNDSHGKVHYMDEGMFLGKIDKDGDISMKLTFQRAYGSGSKVVLRISKKPFSYDCKDSDLLEYTIGTTEGKTQQLNYNQEYQVKLKGIKANDELYLEWTPVTSADLSSLLSFKDFILTTES